MFLGKLCTLCPLIFSKDIFGSKNATEGNFENKTVCKIYLNNDNASLLSAV